MPWRGPWFKWGLISASRNGRFGQGGVYELKMKILRPRQCAVPGEAYLQLMRNTENKSLMSAYRTQTVGRASTANFDLGLEGKDLADAICIRGSGRIISSGFNRGWRSRPNMRPEKRNGIVLFLADPMKELKLEDDIKIRLRG
jgi:hypothetical protein